MKRTNKSLCTYAVIVLHTQPNKCITLYFVSHINLLDENIGKYNVYLKKYYFDLTYEKFRMLQKNNIYPYLFNILKHD